jgi:hypothetical protein
MMVVVLGVHLGGRDPFAIEGEARVFVV